MLGRLAGAGQARAPHPPQSVVFTPTLIDPDGLPVSGRVLVFPVTLPHRRALVRVQDPIDRVPIIPADRMQHILARHSAFASSPDPDAGVFYPQYSTPPALTELAEEVYAQAGPDDIGPSRGQGRFALIAGALLLLNTDTGETQPRLVGTVRPNGSPTNIVVLFVTSSRVLWTMYPAGPVLHFRGL